MEGEGRLCRPERSAHEGHGRGVPIEAEAEQIYVADVTSNGETTRQYLRTDKAGRNGTVSVKTFELGDAE